MFTVEGELLSRCEAFDEVDLDAALARFDELSRPTRRVENAATRVYERWQACFAARDWNAIAETLADDASIDDRRRVVNAGLRHGRDALIAEISGLAEVGVKNVTSEVIATRGEHLVLNRARYSGSDEPPEMFYVDVLDMVEIDADERFVALVTFDVDDIDAAFAELDARYLAGEAAEYAHTWSVIAGAYAAFNRHELPETTPDFVMVDHRPVAMFDAGNLAAGLDAGWGLTPDASIYIEAVHRLTDLGAVVTWAANGTSQDGFDAEWRVISLAAVEGDLIKRSELFDEADVDAAVARFDELSRQAPRLENDASRVDDRFKNYFAARDWDAMTKILADDFSIDDRRRVVNIGIRNGSDVEIANMRAAAEIGTKAMTFVVIATRGKRLALSRIRASGRDQRPEAFHTEALGIVEINADNRIAARVAFDLDDIDAAFEELEARYAAGEAAAHARTWSVMAQAFAATNRREMPEFMPDFVNIDHRRARGFTPGDLTAYMRATWDLAPDVIAYAEAVHQLSNLGAVFTQAVSGTSQDGFEAEWREIVLATVDGNLINRIELFEEADIDAALAHFDELSTPMPRLENAAGQVYERFWTCLEARDWAAMAEIMTDDISTDDRRRVVGAGVRHGRDAQIADMRAVADLGITKVTSTVMATRGERLILTRARYSGRDQGADAYLSEVLGVYELDADDRIAAVVTFDVDDIDAAFEELDARYLAGEAAVHAHTWSVIAGSFAAVNRHELPELTPDWVNIDHRRAVAFAPGDMTAYIHATLDDTPDFRVYLEAVHRLSDLGAVVTWASNGTSQAGFQAEWREISIATVEGDLINRSEMFGETDLDAALARFDELSRPAPQLENTASRVYERMWTYFAARDWAGMAETVAPDVLDDDRRRVVNAGVRRGRQSLIASVRAIAEVGAESVTSLVVATRGERLALSRVRLSARRGQVSADVLNVAEIDVDNRIAASVVFDLDDIDAAFEELEARYLAGEAAAHSRTWSLIARNYAAFNGHEFPSAAPDWVTIDHRRVTSAEPGDLTAYIRSAWDVTPDMSVYIETVHRVSDLGAVLTQVTTGTSHQGFEAEWREICVLRADGELFSGCELFDEEDIDAALERFDELSRPAPRLENAACRVHERLNAYFGARDWAAITDILAADLVTEDRRRVVNAGIRHGRDAYIAELRSIVEVGIDNITWTAIATRGELLTLSRAHLAAFQTDVLSIVEIDADNRIAAYVAFDLDDIDAAFAELDARYLSGEAAEYAHTWSLVAHAYAAVNRRELAERTPDWVFIDHRRLAMVEAENMAASFRAGWDITPQARIYIETVHRLSSLGAVVTHSLRGTSQEGFHAEWRSIDLVTFKGDLLDRTETFDETDLDAALARFDELSQPAPRLENAATRVYQRLQKYFLTRDWDSLTETLAEDHYGDDRRRVVNAGIQRGRNAEIASLQATADMGVSSLTITPIAVRGNRLALYRTRGTTNGPDAFYAELLRIVEINADNQMAARIVFDLNDIDAAFAELDARYAAGEAAAHAHTWSVIANGYAALNRRELAATTPDWVDIDHRRGIAAARGDLTPYIRAAWDVMAQIKEHIEAVHRLTNLGAVVTRVSKGTSKEGFDAEWREIDVTTVEGDLINRSEKFDEADLDAAVARFDELNAPASLLANAAIRAWARQIDALNHRDVDGFLAGITEDGRLDDRRKGLRAVMEGSERQRAFHELFTVPSSWRLEMEPIAIRGSRLSLTRERSRDTDDDDRPITIELLTVIEIGNDDLVHDTVSFDVDNIDAAFAELDARYLAGEAAAYSHTWALIAQTYAAFNRQELSRTSPDWVNIDHRRGIGSAPGDMLANVSALWEVAPDISTHIEAVHRLSSLGAVFTHTESGTSQEGFDAEWREVALLTIEGDAINRCELFDEADLDAALTKFDELSQPVPHLENTATRTWARLADAFNRRDVEGALALTAVHGRYEDRRKGLRDKGTARDVWQTVFDAPKGWRLEMEPVATRGSRLGLTRGRFRDTDYADRPITVEYLTVTGVSDDDLMHDTVIFDLDDIDAAFEELDARYLAGEAAAYSHTWSVIAQAYAALNRHELFATTPDWVNIDHRRATAVEAGDLTAYMRAAWDDTPDIIISIEAVHRLGSLGAVFTQSGCGTSHEGFYAEWRGVGILTVEGNLINHCEWFDEADIDAALARFDELSRSAPQLNNVATRVLARMMDAFNRRDLGSFLAAVTADGRYEDRRKGLRDQGPIKPDFARTLFSEAPPSWQEETEPVAIRGPRLVLCRVMFRDRSEVDRPIAVEALILIELTDDELAYHIVIFDPDDINSAMAELTARWIASGEVAHPEIIETARRLNDAVNRDDWEAFATLNADATFVNHRQLSSPGVQTIADYMPSMRAAASQLPNHRVEIAEILTHSASGLVIHLVLTGTSTEGFAVEFPVVALILLDGERITHLENFDPDKRDLALARFEEFIVKDPPK